jgi:glycosyltransferase involved in cell wall biosynthesis
VGELSERKNHRVIIEALSKLEDERYVFLICGKAMTNFGTYDFLKKYAEEKNVRVKFLGFRKDIPELNKCADIAVLPSLREGLGLAGIEALASGVPVIGSRVQGIKDYVIDGKTGYLCSPLNADEFADKIKLLSDVNLRRSMKNACIDKAEEFRMDISHKQMSEIYEQLLAKKS